MKDNTFEAPMEVLIKVVGQALPTDVDHERF
jgi:hypothetical protein